MRRMTHFLLFGLDSCSLIFAPSTSALCTTQELQCFTPTQYGDTLMNLLSSRHICFAPLKRFRLVFTFPVAEKDTIPMLFFGGSDKLRRASLLL